MAILTKHELREALLAGLSGKTLHAQHLIKVIKTLQQTDLDAVSRLHCDSLIVLVRDLPQDCIPNHALRRRLNRTFSLIQIDGSPVAIQGRRSTI
jgi:hypothetical protein